MEWIQNTVYRNKHTCFLHRYPQTIDIHIEISVCLLWRSLIIFFSSFLEIYNERVHDLLVGEAANVTCHSLPRRKGNVRKDLRVREHPARGPYVQSEYYLLAMEFSWRLFVLCENYRKRLWDKKRIGRLSSRWTDDVKNTVRNKLTQKTCCLRIFYWKHIN